MMKKLDAMLHSQKKCRFPKAPFFVPPAKDRYSQTDSQPKSATINCVQVAAGRHLLAAPAKCTLSQPATLLFPFSFYFLHFPP